MGVDFILELEKKFRRGWDKRGKEMAELTLFALRPEVTSRTVSVELGDRGGLQVDGECLLRTVSGDLGAYSRDNRRLGVCRNAPADMTLAIRETGGIAVGRVVRAHPISGRIDVEVVK